jgi:hypothetical protein
VSDIIWRNAAAIYTFGCVSLLASSSSNSLQSPEKSLCLFTRQRQESFMYIMACKIIRIPWTCYSELPVLQRCTALRINSSQTITRTL